MPTPVFLSSCLPFPFGGLSPAWSGHATYQVLCFLLIALSQFETNKQKQNQTQVEHVVQIRTITPMDSVILSCLSSHQQSEKHAHSTQLYGEHMLVAASTIRKGGDEAMEAELWAFKRLGKHPQLTQLIGISEEPSTGRTVLVTEYAVSIREAI